MRSERHLAQTKRGGGEEVEVEVEEVGVGEKSECRSGEVGSVGIESPSFAAFAAEEKASPASRCSTQSFPILLGTTQQSLFDR